MLNNINLELTIGSQKQLLDIKNLCQIVFVGKSNVGKSSLINAMLNRKNLAHTSNSPGKTQTINFYNVDQKFYFVDLPGYGYAAASKQKISSWSKLIEKYLSDSKLIRLVFLLIDIRHTPGQNDKLMYDWLKFYGFNLIIIATKSDKIKTSQLNERLNDIKNTLALDKKTILPFSSKSKINRDKLWNIIKQNLK